MGPTNHGTVTGRVIIYRRPPESPAMTTHRPPTTVRLIGVPTDIGASVRGASMGPEAMRVARAEIDRLMKEVDPGAQGEARNETPNPPGEGAKSLAQNDAGGKGAEAAPDENVKEGAAKSGQARGLAPNWRK